ncbi:hypothetical protein [Cryptosporangium sp. NPDC051539]|uniref:hypothetical protein n=1 Tax=Cryptosporangium sp. NPDC051539 TaxID=3363962 RepID=UPI0037B33717
MTSSPVRYQGRHELVRVGPVRARRWPVALLVVASAAVAYAGAALAGPFSAPVPDRFESALITKPDGVAGLQVTAYTALRGSSVTAARELMVLASVVTVLLIAVLVRRFGLSVPATVLAAVVTAGLPWALAAHRTVTPVNLAVPWLLAAALLAGLRARRRPALGLAGVCLLVAALTAPVVVPIAVTAIAVLLAGHDIGIGWPPPARVIAVAGLAVLAVATMVAAVGPWAQPAGVIAPHVLDLVAVAAVALGAGFGAVVRWLRPFALIVFVGVGAAALSTPSRTPLLLVTLPAAAVVLGAAFDAAAEAAGVFRRGFRTLTAVVVLVVVGASLLVAVPSARADTSAVVRTDPSR